MKPKKRFKFKFLRIVPPKTGKSCKKCGKRVAGKNAAPKLTADGVRTWTCRSCQTEYFREYRKLRVAKRMAKYAKILKRRKSAA